MTIYKLKHVLFNQPLIINPHVEDRWQQTVFKEKTKHFLRPPFSNLSHAPLPILQLYKNYYQYEDNINKLWGVGEGVFSLEKRYMYRNFLDWYRIKATKKIPIEKSINFYKLLYFSFCCSSQKNKNTKACFYFKVSYVWRSFHSKKKRCLNLEVFLVVSDFNSFYNILQHSTTKKQLWNRYDRCFCERDKKCKIFNEWQASIPLKKCIKKLFWKKKWVTLLIFPWV